MTGRFLTRSNVGSAEPNIFADKSSLVVEWFLCSGIEREWFSIREVARETGISVGQVQKIVRVLILNGCLKTSGVRTAKKFRVKNPHVLLQSWIDYYSILKKCKMYSYQTGMQGRKQALDILSKSNLQKNVVLALHSAAEALGCKNTNLETLELYIYGVNSRELVEKTLQLEPQERGYEILLIEPYYKNMLRRSMETSKQKILTNSSPLLTFLDLYHFPLRGLEQAEFLAERFPILRRIYKTRK